MFFSKLERRKTFLNSPALSGGLNVQFMVFITPHPLDQVITNEGFIKFSLKEIGQNYEYLCP